MYASATDSYSHILRSPKCPRPRLRLALLPVARRVDPHHVARVPVDGPLRPLDDNVLGLPRAGLQQERIAHPGIDHVVPGRPPMDGAPLARLAIEGLVAGVRCLALVDEVRPGRREDGIVGTVRLGHSVTWQRVRVTWRRVYVSRRCGRRADGGGGVAAGGAVSSLRGSLEAPLQTLSARYGHVLREVHVVDGRRDTDGGGEGVEPGREGLGLEARQEELVCPGADADDEGASGARLAWPET